MAADDVLHLVVVKGVSKGLCGFVPAVAYGSCSGSVTRMILSDDPIM